MKIVVGEVRRREFGGLGFSFWGHTCSKKDSYCLSQRNTHSIPVGIPNNHKQCPATSTLSGYKYRDDEKAAKDQIE